MPAPFFDKSAVPTRRGLVAALALAWVGLAGCSHGPIAARRAEPAPEPKHEHAKAREVEIGEASYYHPRFEGRLTASGEAYRGKRMTCAHRRLAFGTRVRVTRLDTGKRVVVVVNDRGPFVRGRLVDLSLLAARRIGLIEKGHAQVRLEILEE